MAKTKLNPDTLKERSLGCLMGVFLGDCMGLPVETMSPSEIRSRFGYVDDMIKNPKHKFKSVARQPAGTKSDDSQLTLALMDSLSRMEGYSKKDIAKAHVEAWEGKWGTPVGWGNATRQAVDLIKNNKNSCVPDAAGNGPPMKIAPLAIYGVYKCLSTPHGKFTNSFNRSLLKKCKEVSTITHGDLGCTVAAYCQARMIVRAIQGEMSPFPKVIARQFIEDAEFAQQHLNITDNNDHNMANRLKEFLKDSDLDMDVRKISTNICTEGSGWVYNSYPLVAYCVAKYAPYKNFKYAITETLNAGADADTNASMVGAIVGGQLGIKQIPVALIKKMKSWRTLVSQARLFEQSL